MCSDQLDLLTWKTPARVVPFPLAANIGRVRRCAEILERKQGKAADAYWRRVVEPMADRLAKIGLPVQVIQRELDESSDAVQSEMRKRAWQGRGQRPGGDAA
jgi:hypothetical protein